MSKEVEILSQFIGSKLDFVPSKLTRWLNGTLTEVKKGSIVIEYKVTEDMLNPFQVLHGGVIAAMLDDTVGLTIFTSGESYFYTTINLNVDYFSSLKVGDIALAESELIKHGSKVSNLILRLKDSNEKLIAMAHTNLIRTNIPVSKFFPV